MTSEGEEKSFMPSTGSNPATGFRDFASSLQPLFKMVSHNIIKDDIMKIFKFEKGKMSSYLEKLETRMAITTDMWTSNQKKGYMAITVHYIDEFVYMPPPHTKEVLFDVLLDFLLDWNMDRKLSTITVDNCSKCCILVSNTIKSEKFEDAARQLSLPCNKKLCLDCRTQWNSKYLMLSIAITYKDVFLYLKQRENLSP
ncbi:hypothetical protein AAG906_013062 [Vitis piasezkii]